ncbi:MAG TPA: hypothetical protein VN634_16985 [Candidatus Limnocylindrales bacterium]|nr:hypothetical protein [Candidatus Limnocylindrales bacterium]
MVLAFGAMLLSCSGSGDGDGGGGGDDRVRLFFGINNDGGCKSLVFDVDVADAQAVIERNGNAVDCTLNAALTNDGCDATFTLINNNDTLRVSITGCTIPAVTNVFLCDFVDADISELTDQTVATCSCKNNGCDTTPPVCISEVQDPGSCEDCDNHIDDDGNDLIDCADPNCEHSPLCGNVGETSTTTSSTFIDVITSSTTTTTLEPTETCTLTYRMTTDVTAGGLSWETDYAGTDGGFRGKGSAVKCDSIVPGALAAFSDNDHARVLSSGLVSLSGIDGPADLVECKFDVVTEPLISDFDITVTEATDVDVNPIRPFPAIIIKSLDCVPVTTTTTEGNTTTTIDGGGTTTTIPGGGTTTTIPGGTTTTTLPGPTDTYSITFRLNSASAPVGALQFSVNYAGAPGEFEGTGGDVTCTGGIEGALFAPNDIDASRKLSLGIIALDAFSAPVNVATCKFVANDEIDVPTPADFIITIDDATDADGADVTVGVGAVVTPVH